MTKSRSDILSLGLNFDQHFLEVESIFTHFFWQISGGFIMITHFQYHLSSLDTLNQYVIL